MAAVLGEDNISSN